MNIMLMPLAGVQATREFLESQGEVYNRECIADARCPEPERIAAAYDYVGRVYGSGDGRYDQVLMPAERDDVERTFGKITEAAKIPNLLFRAHNNYFAAEGNADVSADCRNAAYWGIVRGVDQFFGEGLALGGVHNCGSQFGELYIQTGWEQKIAANPGLWMFFVELSRQDERESREALLTQEVGLFYRVADRLGIPVRNPLASVDSEAVILEMEKTGVSREEMAASFVIALLHDWIYASPHNQAAFSAMTPAEKSAAIYQTIYGYLVSRERSHPQIPKTLETFGIPSDKFFQFCTSFLVPPQGQDPVAFFEAQFEKVAGNVQKMVEISNRLSVSRAQGELQASGKKGAFFQMGQQHLPILEKIYPGAQSIPLDSVSTVENR